MPGTGVLNWLATFEGGDESVINAELYDDKGEVVRSQPVLCDPPIECPFPMDIVAYGSYTAGLSTGTNRYYYQGEQEITTVANAAELAAPVVLDASHNKVDVTIHVQV